MNNCTPPTRFELIWSRSAAPFRSWTTYRRRTRTSKKCVIYQDRKTTMRSFQKNIIARHWWLGSPPARVLTALPAVIGTMLGNVPATVDAYRSYISSVLAQSPPIRHSRLEGSWTRAKRIGCMTTEYLSGIEAIVGYLAVAVVVVERGRGDG